LPLLEVPLQITIVRVQQTRAAHLGQGENVRIIRLVSALILEFSRPVVDIIFIQDSHLACFCGLACP